MSPQLKSLLARGILIGGVALVATFLARHAPQEQTLAIRLGDHDVSRIQGVVTALDDSEPTSGFSQVFPEKSPRFVRHRFRAAAGTYTVVISLEERFAGDAGPNLNETSFERRVSLAGGEVIVSPD